MGKKVVLIFLTHKQTHSLECPFRCQRCHFEQVWREFVGLHYWRQWRSWPCCGSSGWSSSTSSSSASSFFVIIVDDGFWLSCQVAKQGLNVVLVARNKVRSCAVFVWCSLPQLARIPSIPIHLTYSTTSTMLHPSVKKHQQLAAASELDVQSW